MPHEQEADPIIISSFPGSAALRLPARSRFGEGRGGKLHSFESSAPRLKSDRQIPFQLLFLSKGAQRFDVLNGEVLRGLYFNGCMITKDKVYLACSLCLSPSSSNIMAFDDGFVSSLMSFEGMEGETVAHDRFIVIITWGKAILCDLMPV
jgi:hypothetical protein